MNYRTTLAAFVVIVMGVAGTAWPYSVKPEQPVSPLAYCVAK